MKLKPSKIIVLLISLALLTFVFRACGWYGSSINGRVLEEGSKTPVADAYVVVRWQSRVAAGFAGGETACYHVEVVKTDKKGDYKTPVWWSPGWHSSFGHSNAVNVYRTGYEVSDLMYDKIISYRQSIYYLKPFKGTRGDRLDYMFKLQYGLRCGRSAGASSLNLNKLINAMYEEAISTAVTPEEKKKAENFKGWLYKLSDVEGREVIDTEHGWKK